MNAKYPKPRTHRIKEKTENTPLPLVWRRDSRPDPSALSAEGRALEFGRIIFHAIERRRAKAKE